MTDYWTEQKQTPTLDVLVMRNGTIIHREFCEAVSQVNDVIREWGDIEGALIDVVDVVASDQSLASADLELYEDEEHNNC